MWVIGLRDWKQAQNWGKFEAQQSATASQVKELSAAVDDKLMAMVIELTVNLNSGLTNMNESNGKPLSRHEDRDQAGDAGG